MSTAITLSSTICSTDWVSYPVPRPSARMRLFCFPYAGAGSAVYCNWPKRLPETVEVALVRLPGRESRLNEAPYRRLTQMVEDIAVALLPDLDRPFAFFGHSMGAMISFELARELRRLGEGDPTHLFVSGRPAPQIMGQTPNSYQLPDAELIEELKRLGGTPPEVFEHMELLRLMLPIIRTDFEVVQTYAYRPEPPLRCPITAYGGLEDSEVSHTEVAAWRAQTTSTFKQEMFPGGHFFLSTMQASFLRLLSCELERAAGAYA